MLDFRYIFDFFMYLVISMYPHMYMKIVFITLQALRMYKITWANKDLKMLSYNVPTCTAQYSIAFTI